MNRSSYDEFVSSLTKSSDNIDNKLSMENDMSTSTMNKKRKIHEADSVVDDNKFGYVEVKKLEHCTRTLQKNIRLLIDDAPDSSKVEQLLDSNVLDENVIFDLENNQLVKLATQLKTKYVNGELGIFDAIINNNIAGKEEEFSGGLDSGNIKGHSDTNYQTISAPVEHLPVDEAGVPILPVINDAKLYNRVFVHKSIINNKSYLHKAELMASHNERLEFLGDSVLNNLVTVIIFDRFPEASEGELSKIRSLLVNNVTLAEFSILYGFDKKLRSNINEQILKDSTQKIYADIFEAYIGALAIDRNYDYAGIQQWLEELMGSRLDKHAKQISSTEEINKDAKSELYSLIGTAAFHPQYVVVQLGDGSSKPFIIKCTMGDDTLGIGIAPSNKDAGLRAAMEALKNKRLLEKYSQIRFNMDRSQSVISNRPVKTTEPSLSKTRSTNGSDLSMFPIIAEMSGDLDNKAKNELYSILGKNVGAIPDYESSEMPSKKFKVELKVKGVHIATAIDSTKKRASTRAAMAVMNSKSAIEALCGL